MNDMNLSYIDVLTLTLYKLRLDFLSLIEDNLSWKCDSGYFLIYYFVSQLSSHDKMVMWRYLIDLISISIIHGQVVPRIPSSNPVEDALPVGPGPGPGSRSRMNPAAAPGPVRTNNRMNSPVNCAATGRSAISQCFQTNGGIQMQFVVALLSNGTQGQIPRNSEQLKAAICGSQGRIIACVFNNINGLRNSPQCTTMAEYIRLEQETVILITGMQQMCGNGPLPPPSACHKNLDQNLRSCYSKVDLSPDLFNSGDPLSAASAGMKKIIGGIIGENIQVAKKFCSVKKRLFSCMKETVDKCEGAAELTSLSGYDHASLQKGIDVLCRDINVYVDGLKCFQNPTPEVKQCYNKMVEAMTNLTSEQLRRQMPLQEFHTRFCQLKIQHTQCDLKGWRNECEKKTVGLKNEFECNLLPTRCKNDPTLQTSLQQTCAVQNYERHLRSGAETRMSKYSLIISMVSFVLVLFL